MNNLWKVRWRKKRGKKKEEKKDNNEVLIYLLDIASKK